MQYGGRQQQDVFAAPDGPELSGVIDERYVQAELDDSEDSVAAPGPREQVFIPSERVPPGATEVQLELRNTEDGRLALLCYESLDLLLAACGNGQAWISVYREQLDNVQRSTGADVVLWNAALPEDSRAEG